MKNFNLDKYAAFAGCIFDATTEQGLEDVLIKKTYGQTAPLAAGATSDIWEESGAMTLLSAASTLTVSSASADDDEGGTGAIEVFISGLDADYNILTETVTLNGTSNVVTTNSFLRVNRSRVVLAGSGKTNAGDISIISTTGSFSQGKITAGESVTHFSHFTVPAGYTAFTTDVHISCYRTSGNGVREGLVEQLIYDPVGNTITETLKYGISSSASFNDIEVLYTQSPEKSTVYFKVTSDSNNAAFTVSTGELLLKGDYNRFTKW